MEHVSKFLKFEILHIGSYVIKVYSLLLVILIILLTRFVIWILKIGFFKKCRFKNLGNSSAYSLFQIIRYLLWIVSITFIFEALGISLTVLLAGSAALLVGVGLGLQQTFNDFISGIILLIEGTTRIGDVLEIDGDVVTIQKIGMRTSRGMNRDDIIVIIPNSLITTNKVINWSHQSKKTRFRINVGVAYGSNVELVTRLLEESAFEHQDITDRDLIEARLTDFGNSSLNFQVLFYSDNVFRIEKVKSDIRRIINRKFSENKVTIPFPQMEIHIKSGEADLI